MKKYLSSQTMDEVLQEFLGNKPSMETPKPELQPAEIQEQQEQASEAVEKTGEAAPEQANKTPQVVRRISGKQRRASLEEYKEEFLRVPSIEDRKPVFLSRSTRDALDRIVRMFGERRMSVSGLVENIARQHLAAYGEDIEAWRKTLRIKERINGEQFGVTLNQSNGVLRGASLCFGHIETACSHSEIPWRAASRWSNQ